MSEEGFETFLVKFSDSRRRVVENQCLGNKIHKKRSLREILTFFYFPVIATSTILAPLNRIKIVLQVKDTIPGFDKKLPIYKVISSKYNSKILAIYKVDGIRGFFKGNYAFSLKIFIQMSCKTIFFDRFLYHANEYKKFIDAFKYKFFGINFVLAVISAFGASMINLIFTYPFDLAFCRLAASNLTDTQKNFAHFNKIKDCFQKIEYATENQKFSLTQDFPVKKYFIGINAAIYESLVYFSITFTGYQIFYRFYQSKNEKVDDRYFIKFIKMVGATSFISLIASTFAYPLDTVKRNMQVNGIPGFKNEHPDMSSAYKNISQSGISNFYKGFSLHLMRNIPFSYIQFYIYTQLMTTLPEPKKVHNEISDDKVKTNNSAIK